MDINFFIYATAIAIICATAYSSYTIGIQKGMDATITMLAEHDFIRIDKKTDEIVSVCSCKAAKP
tara:strand:+ start:132 stop:326 length:195 start_codon:yes stop_codon:yes gene_type:complete